MLCGTEEKKTRKLASSALWVGSEVRTAEEGLPQNLAEIICSFESLAGRAALVHGSGSRLRAERSSTWKLGKPKKDSVRAVSARDPDFLGGEIRMAGDPMGKAHPC